MEESGPDRIGQHLLQEWSGVEKGAQLVPLSSALVVELEVEVEQGQNKEKEERARDSLGKVVKWEGLKHEIHHNLSTGVVQFIK